MTRAKISQLDAAAANNTDINAVNVAEGCPPSGINNAIREMGAMLKRMDNGTDHLTDPNITGSLDVDNINIDGNTISSSNTNGNINITPNGTGGVAVTGGLTVDGNASLSGAGTGSRYLALLNETNTYAGRYVLQAGGGSSGFGGGLVMYGHSHASNAGDVVAGISSGSGGSFRVNNSGLDGGGNVLKVQENGDISFYADNGTTQGFFWDASTQRLGLGITSPAAPIDIAITSNQGLLIDATAGNNAYLTITNNGSNSGAKIGFDNASNATVIGHHTRGDIIYANSSGNVGIGTSSPQYKLAVSNAGGNGLEVRPDFSGDTETRINSYNRSGGNYTTLSFDTGVVKFRQFGTTDAVTIDSSNNLLVATTSLVVANSASNNGYVFNTNGELEIGSTSRCLTANRQGSDGDAIRFQKDGTTVGSIGTTSGDFYITKSGSNQTGIYFNELGMLPMQSGSISDNTRDIGQSTYRWDDIYATNGTIQTSDANEKQDIEELTDAEQRVAVAAKGLLRKYRWKDSVAEKGDDARIHFGIIAQDLKAAFEAEGLDAGRYAMFINSEWTDEETGEQKSRMGIRYNQLLAFIIAAI